jgi:hypothetical protein
MQQIALRIQRLNEQLEERQIAFYDSSQYDS